MLAFTEKTIFNHSGKEILMKKVITVTGMWILLSMAGCSDNNKTSSAPTAPTVTDIEQAMVNEYVAMGVDKETAAKMVGLEKVNKCDSPDDKKNPGVHVCEVKAKVTMAADKTGKEGAIIKVAIRQQDGKWETVEGIINEGHEPEAPVK